MRLHHIQIAGRPAGPGPAPGSSGAAASPRTCRRARTRRSGRVTPWRFISARMVSSSGIGGQLAHAGIALQGVQQFGLLLGGFRRRDAGRVALAARSSACVHLLHKERRSRRRRSRPACTREPVRRRAHIPVADDAAGEDELVALAAAGRRRSRPPAPPPACAAPTACTSSSPSSMSSARPLVQRRVQQLVHRQVDAPVAVVVAQEVLRATHPAAPGHWRRPRGAPGSAAGGQPSVLALGPAPAAGSDT